MNYTKEVISGDKLKRTVWNFYLIENMTFVLNSYYTYEKESLRRKNWQQVLRYDRISGRDNNFSENEVPIPQFVLIGLRDHINDMLKVQKWSEYKASKK